MLTYKLNLFALAAAMAAVTLASAPGQVQAQERPKPVVPADTTKKNLPLPGTDVNLGYITINSNSSTGAISVLSAGKIDEQARVSADLLLQGQAAGVQVINSSGAAGAGALLNIRGMTTLNAGSFPLYIVDGIPVKSARLVNPIGRNADNNPLADLNPLDIARITVLKDAQATAAYGMRGANGVVLIDTYGGTTGKTLLDFSAFSGVMSAPETPSVFSAAGYRPYIIEKELARGLTQQQVNSGVGRYLLLSTPPSQVQRYNNDTDWQDLVTRNSLYNDYHFNLRGGDAVTFYSLNTGYTTQSGGIENTNFNRFSSRFNLDYKVGRKLSFLNSLSYNQTRKRLNDGGNAFNTNPLYVAALKSPTLAAFQQDLEGTDLRDPDSVDYAGRSNPYSIVERMRNESSTNHISGRIIGKYQFTPSLNLRVGVYGDFFRLNEKRFRPSAGFAMEENILRESSTQNSVELMALNENVLTYSKTSETGRHALSMFVGNAIQNTSVDSKFGVYVNANSDQLSTVNADNQRFIDTLTSFSPTWNLLSFFAGGQYAYKGKYLLGANFRADGSSRFEEGHRWGYFPSVSAGWLVSSEPFLSGSNTLNHLKLRASYGLTGNQEVGYYNSFNAAVPAGYFNYPGVRLGLLGNEQFTWEETAQFNAGFDGGLWRNRLTLTADFYVKNTSNLYNRIALPGISGFQSYPVSEGKVRNKGIEVSLSAKVINGRFGWLTSINSAYNKNTIEALPALMERVTSYGDFTGISQAGSPIGSFYGYNALGVYRSTSEVTVKNGAANTNPFQGGDIIFEDLDKNGIIDERDRKIIGKSMPDFFGVFMNTFTYKQFDLNVFMDFSVGNDVYNGQRASLEAMATYDNQSTSIESRWRKDGDQTDMPRALHGDAVGNTRFSSRWIEDGSYLRFKTVSLGYTLASEKFLKGAFKSARITVIGQNLHTFSKFSGQSPEVANVTNPVMYSQSYGNLPQLRAFLLGIKLGL
jgi:TonB-dependent starch-binding outer membrane protein SusC